MFYIIYYLSGLLPLGHVRAEVISRAPQPPSRAAAWTVKGHHVASSERACCEKRRAPCLQTRWLIIVTVAGTWQKSGHAGRHDLESVAGPPPTRLRNGGAGAGARPTCSDHAGAPRNPGGRLSLAFRSYEVWSMAFDLTLIRSNFIYC